MNNQERKQELTYLAELYCPDDKDLILSKMPIFQEDEEGTQYAEYFQFLQEIYSLRGDVSDITTYELMHIKQRLLDIAQQFRYPTKQILVLGE